MTAHAAFEAVRSGDPERLARILREDPSLARARNEQGVSLLLFALYERRRDLADLILASNPSLDVFEAAAFGRLETLAALLDEDPDRVNAWSGDGFGPLHLACFFGQGAAALLLLERGARTDPVSRNPLRVTPLHSAAASRGREICRALVEKGAPVNAREQGGFTALHAAALHGDAELARILLRHGADPWVKSEDGKTALELAAAHPEVAGLLRERMHASS